MTQPCPVSDAQPLSRRARSVRRAQKWPPRAPNRAMLTALDPCIVMAKMVSVPSGTWLRLLEMPSSRNASSNSFPTGGVCALVLLVSGHRRPSCSCTAGTRRTRTSTPCKRHTCATSRPRGRRCRTPRANVPLGLATAGWLGLHVASSARATIASRARHRPQAAENDVSLAHISYRCCVCCGERASRASVVV